MKFRHFFTALAAVFVIYAPIAAQNINPPANPASPANLPVIQPSSGGGNALGSSPASNDSGQAQTAYTAWPTPASVFVNSLRVKIGPKVSVSAQPVRNTPKKRGQPKPASGHRDVYRALKQWDLVSKSYVDAHDNQVRVATKTNSTNSAGSPATTPGPEDPNSQPKAGGRSSQATSYRAEKNRSVDNMWTPWIVVAIIAALVLLGTVVWWWGALVFRRRGLWDENRAQSQSFDPHQRVFSVSSTETSKDRSVLRITPADVAIAEAQAHAEVATANALAAEARATARRLEVMEARERLYATHAPHGIHAVAMCAGGPAKPAEAPKPEPGRLSVDEWEKVHKLLAPQRQPQQRGGQQPQAQPT